MKIFLYIATPGGMTGAPRRFLTLTEVLRERGLEVCIASEFGNELLTAAEALEFETAAVDATGVLELRRGALLGGRIVFRFRVVLALLRQNLIFCWRVRARKADVVLMRGSKGVAFAGLGALLSCRPLIWDVDYELPSRGIVRWLHRFGLWASKAMVFQYGATAVKIFGHELARRYDYKFNTITPGIDMKCLQAHAKGRRNRKLARSEEFVVLQVGTICDRKNQGLLIEVIKEIDCSVLPIRLRVQLVGSVFDEKYARELREKVARAGLEDVVEFLGWRDDVHDLMAAADLVAMPSKDEGVPNTIQEAMYIGVPVIVSDAGGMPEVVQHGKTGWILPLDDALAWADRIKSCAISDDRCAAVGKAASEYAALHFGTNEWGRRYAEVIQRTCRG